MAYFFQPNLVALLVQAAGALLMAALCIALLRTMARPALRAWATGWVMLCVSVQALYLASLVPAIRVPLHTIYLLGEYVFGYLVYAGCRRYALGEPPSRAEVWLLMPATTWCVGLAYFAGGNDDLLFAIHTLVYPYLFFRALRVLGRIEPGPRARVGLGVMKLSLLLLTITYLHYAPLRAAASYQNLRAFDAYLAYAPLYDLLFQVLLMFGMVMTATGRVQQELETANADLERARDRLEATARMDPLTSALNRRAFTAVLADRSRDGRGFASGVVAVIDLDALKGLNDQYGHAAGDAALLALAEALRNSIKPEDLLFRWGGDEFVLLLRGETAASATDRLAVLNQRLEGLTIPGCDEPVNLRASVGLSEFVDALSLHRAIEEADKAMYRKKKTA